MCCPLLASVRMYTGCLGLCLHTAAIAYSQDLGRTQLDRAKEVGEEFVCFVAVSLLRKNSPLSSLKLPSTQGKALCPYPQRYQLTVASVDVREDADITSPRLFGPKPLRTCGFPSFFLVVLLKGTCWFEASAHLISEAPKWGLSGVRCS